VRLFPASSGGGTSITLKGSVANASLLPPTGNSVGDAYINDDDGNLYVWTGTAWNDGGQIVGPQGPPGADGADGADALWNFTGAYSVGASYAVGDLVTYAGQTWYRINSNGGNTGDTPSEGTFWTLIAAEGDVGPTGTLNDLSDVVITAPEEFQTLEYNGTNWVNTYSSVVSYVRNAEATTLTTGTCVYLFGSTGDHATVKRADNNSDTTSSKTVGLVGAPILASENGPVITRGYVDGIDLSTGYAAGDVLWLGENGAFTKTKPVAPDHLVFIGVVVRATNNGIVYVATQNGYELDELHDVSIVDKTSGDLLKYNGSLWVNSQINLNNLSDVVVSTPLGKQLLVYDDATSQWINANPIDSTGIAYKSGVPASPTSTGQVGQLAIDGVNAVLYVCTSTNNWQKVSLNAANFSNAGGFA